MIWCSTTSHPGLHKVGLVATLGSITWVSTICRHGEPLEFWRLSSIRKHELPLEMRDTCCRKPFLRAATVKGQQA